MASKALGLRVPIELYERIEMWGLENYPKGEAFDVSKTINTLLDKGLTSGGFPAPPEIPQGSQLDSLLDEKLDEVLNNKLDSLLDEKLDERLKK